MQGMKTARLLALMVVLSAIGALAWTSPAAAAAGPIAGKVTNQSAQALEGIKVCAVVLAPYRESCASTNAAGEYSIPGTGPGYEVHFYDPDGVAPSRAPQWYPGVPHVEEAEVVTEAEIEAGIDAVMQPGAEIRGTIVGSHLGGAPLAGVKVFPDPTTVPLGEVAVHDETGADGTFVLSDLGPGTYHLVFEPEEGINYQAETFTMPPLSAGSAIGAEVPLKAGVEFEGHLTDGTTGLPVEPFGGPGRTPMACALEGFTDERIKCVPVGPGGEYVIAGLPSGGYVLSFGEDTKEEGVDLNPDGYVRQYYEEGLLELVEAPNVLDGLDATLVRGEEIWPGEGPAPWELIREEVSGGATVGDETTETPNSPDTPRGAVAVPAPPLPNPFGVARPHANVLPKYTCKKGFHRVAKGGSSACVKIKKKPKKHRPKKHHAKKAAHR
jgi:hypothetical protein